MPRVPRKGVRDARIGDCIYILSTFSRQKYVWSRMNGCVASIQKRSYRVSTKNGTFTVAFSNCMHMTFIGPIRIASGKWGVPRWL